MEGEKQVSNDKTNFRRERIEKLLHEIRYEVERGMLENEIDETMVFQFVVPISRSLHEGVVWCEFRTRPIHRVVALGQGHIEPRLKVVK